VTRVWLPPTVKAEYQTPLDNKWSGNAKTLQLVSDGKSGATMLYVEFADGATAPVVELISTVQTQSRALDWANPKPVPEGLLGAGVPRAEESRFLSWKAAPTAR
jgi:hypothetical protein